MSLTAGNSRGLIIVAICIATRHARSFCLQELCPGDDGWVLVDGACCRALAGCGVEMGLMMIAAFAHLHMLCVYCAARSVYLYSFMPAVHPADAAA